MLVVLQGIDASGKDGTIRHVMTAFNPQGCTSPASRCRPRRGRHDFLWRIHSPRRARARSRSSTARTTSRSWSSASTTSCRAVWSKHYDQINDFEELLTDERHDDRQVLPAHRARTSSASGSRRATTIRRSAGSSRWAISTERKLWDDYMAAYEDALSKTLDRRGALVRHPGQPQLDAQPRRRRDPGRHDGRPEARLPAEPTCPRTSSSSKRSGGLADAP